ncbi:MAG: hypothetical protein KAS32_25415 [Candidatus Peribacteraceae bacterium]|nr:hypothetical protein [Candidatus Peribacteraceae bacterium]
MALFSSNSISLGLSFTDTHVLAVKLDQERGILLKKHALLPESILNGRIQSMNACSESVHAVIHSEKSAPEVENKSEANLPPPKHGIWKKIMKKKKESGTLGVALCLPPQTVYNTIFDIPLIVGKDIESEVEELIRKTIPEDPEDIMYVWKQIGKTDDMYHIAVAAVSEDALKQYKTLCEKQNFRVEAITIPASVIWLSAAEKQKETALLYSRIGECYIGSSMIHSSQPIDELLFPLETTLEEQTKKSLEIIDDQKRLFKIRPKKIIFMGSDEEFEELKKQDKFSVPIERTTFDVPDRLSGYELGLFSILSARKNTLVNLMKAKKLPKE